MNKYIKLFLMLMITQGLWAQFFNAGVTSIFSDIKANNIGDVVTIYIMENANASRESKMDNSMKTENNASSGVSGALTGFLPVFGANAGISNSQSGTEGTRQNDRLTGKISAIIINKTEQGLLEIEGERNIEINGEINKMRISGLVRPRDIEENNIVYSYKIANAHIQYSKDSGDGRLSKLKPGTLQKIGTWTLGGFMILFALFGSGAI